jgi:aspartate racemase
VIHSIIYEELCLGVIKKDSKEKYLNIIKKLTQDNAQGIILGCTEIGMIICQEDIDAKIYDTTYIHAVEAVNEALKE